MLFVEGENFTLRTQEFERQQNLTLKTGRHYLPDTFIWLPNWSGRQSMIPPMASISIEPTAIRAITIQVSSEMNKASIWPNSRYGKWFPSQGFQKTKAAD